VQPVEKVSINISNNTVGAQSAPPGQSQTISDGQINDLKDFLQTTYGVNKENIFINS